MRILLRDPDKNDTVFAVDASAFACTVEDDGSIESVDIYTKDKHYFGIMDKECCDNYESYARKLCVDGYIDLSKYCIWYN